MTHSSPDDPARQRAARAAKLGLRKLGQAGSDMDATLEVFQAPAGIGWVMMTSDEVTALCPVTGQPDYYTITIRYVPASACVESKSLKLYLHSFRNEGLFCEALAVRICDDIMAAADPDECAVDVAQKARGGIAITAHCEKRRG